MCGRFSLDADYRQIKTHFKLDAPGEIEKRYNIAPSEDIFAVIHNSAGRREGRFFHWGLIPFWAKDRKIGNRMINARAEGIENKPAFRHAFKSRRCLVVMSGFFEWKILEGRRQPFYIHTQDDSLLGIAGIWEQWEDKKSKEIIYSCSVITTSASFFIQDFHTRMPVIIEPAQYDEWLNVDNTNTALLQKMLQPYSGNDLTCHKVTAAMNNAGFKDKEAIKPIE